MQIGDVSRPDIPQLNSEDRAGVRLILCVFKGKLFLASKAENTQNTKAGPVLINTKH